MSTLYTFTVELSDPGAAEDVVSFVEECDELVRPKQPDECHVVIHSGVHPSDNRSIVSDLLTVSNAVSRVGFMSSCDTTDTASGSVYWLEDGELKRSKIHHDSPEDGSLNEQHGSGAARRIRRHLDFEIYSWWDYSVGGMEKRYHRYLVEDVHQEMVEKGLLCKDDESGNGLS
ncbi:hypothetical protein ACFR9U_14150 [Halorientalis brevis]|uniref:Uncharacterized protein n=1 Tax=Halorientalis brevis TaxID=1126241 RepID=A0ABD6CCQ2_9EURY|nr:hypothetical protein [Halorientalis brevis]